MDSPPSPSQSTWSSETVAKVKEIYCVKVKTMTSKGEVYPYGGLQVKAELKPKTRDGTVVYGEVVDNGDGTYTITLTPQAGGPHQLITMDGQHVQKSPCDRYVRRQYNKLCNLEQVIDCNGGPSGHDSGDIYVACINDSRIHAFDQEGHWNRTIDNSGSVGRFNHPSGLFVKGDIMYVADYNNHHIVKLTAEGKFLKQIDQVRDSSIIQYQLKRQVDSYNHRIVILDQDNTWKSTINGNDSSMFVFHHPYSIALDPGGNIHVAAYGSNTIKVFTSDEETLFVRSYGYVKGPTGIAIDKEGTAL